MDLTRPIVNLGSSTTDAACYLSVYSFGKETTSFLNEDYQIAKLIILSYQSYNICNIEHAPAES